MLRKKDTQNYLFQFLIYEYLQEGMNSFFEPILK